MTPAKHGDTRAENLLLASLALIYFLLEWIPGIAGGYGYFIDELYYLACSDHLAFGYVDHPPLSIFLLSVVRAVIGDSLPALRLVPALAGAATVLLTGLIARRLGAGLFGQGLAAGALMIGSVLQVMFSFYSMNSLSLVMWAACFLILVEIERRDDQRLWLAFGVVAGLGLENKHTIVLLAVGLAAGLILTPARRHLRSRWLWGGLAIAALMLLPNLIWQHVNGWPSLEFYRNADLYKNVVTPPLEILKQQVLYMNPAALPVWGAGLIFLLATVRGRPYRHLGWLYATLMLLMLIGQKSRPDRITAAYIILFACGGVLLEQTARRPRGRWLRAVLPAVLILSGVALLPIGLPLLPPGPTASYAKALGIVPQIEKGEGKRTELPQWLADRLGWEEFVDDVESVTDMIEPNDRGRAIILVPSYGHAGAIELFGRGRDLPPVFAVQNNYFLWGPPEDPVDAAVIAGFGDELPRILFRQAEPVRRHDCNWCMPWRDGMSIWLAREPKLPFRDVWAELKHYE